LPGQEILSKTAFDEAKANLQELEYNQNPRGDGLKKAKKKHNCWRKGNYTSIFKNHINQLLFLNCFNKTVPCMQQFRLQRDELFASSQYAHKKTINANC
jgi:hypothetical protein